jgi:hypothetical protein
MTESSKSKLWWFAGLLLRLLFVSFLGIILCFSLMFTLGALRFSSPAVFYTLMTIGMIAGYTWAIYFRFPFFQSRTSRQRLFISAVIAVPTVFLTYYCVMALFLAALDFASTSDRRTESVTLPSGEVLENHTYYEAGWGDGERYNKLFLKNPATGTSEWIDAYGDLNYEAGPDTPSLFAQSPHPQEFIYGDEKVLVLGSYLCQRIKFGNVPYWNITSIGVDTEAQAYLKSFFSTNDILSKSPSDLGLQGGIVPFVFASLDLTNNVLTLKKQMPEGYGNWQQFRHHPDSIFWDEFPSYLVYSVTGFNGGSLNPFPLKFDIARTKAKNGLLWDNLMPPDSSSITVQSAEFGTRRKIADVTARVVELLHTNPDGFTVNVNTLGCDHFPGRKKHLTIKYEFKDFNFTSTNSIGDDVSYQTLINNARK